MCSKSTCDISETANCIKRKGRFEKAIEPHSQQARNDRRLSNCKMGSAHEIKQSDHFSRPPRIQTRKLENIDKFAMMLKRDMGRTQYI